MTHQVCVAHLEGHPIAAEIQGGKREVAFIKHGLLPLNWSVELVSEADTEFRVVDMTKT